MSNKINKFSLSKHATVETDPILLFYQFSCPHCNCQNVQSKTQKQKVILCSASDCRRIVILDNIEDIDKEAA